MASFFPKALLYREWREGRLIFMLAALLTVIGPLMDILHYLSTPTNGPYTQQYLDEFWQSFYRETTNMGTGSFPTLFFVVIWVAVPVLRIVSERGRGGLIVSLSTPIKRSDWIRVKYFVGLVFLLGAMVVYFLLQWGLHFAQPHDIQTTTEQLFRGAGIRCIVYTTFYSVAFLVALCVTNTVAAVLITFCVMLAPTWLSTVVGEMTPGGIMSTVAYQASFAAPHGNLAYELKWLSPMPLLSSTLVIPGNPSYFTWVNGWIYWYIGLAIIAYFVAKRQFWRMKAEEFQNFLTAPDLWYWMLTGISLVIGSIVGSMVVGMLTYRPDQPYTSLTPAQHAHLFTVCFVIAAVVLWLAGWAAGRLYGLRAQRLGRRSRFNVRPF